MVPLELPLLGCDVTTHVHSFLISNSVPEFRYYFMCFPPFAHLPLSFLMEEISSSLYPQDMYKMPLPPQKRKKPVYTKFL